MASKSTDILNGLSFLAEKAEADGDTRLAELIRDAVRTYNGESPAAPAILAVEAISEEEDVDQLEAPSEEPDLALEVGEGDRIEAGIPAPEITEVTEVTDGPVPVPGVPDFDALMAQMGNDVDDAVYAEVTPTTLELKIVGLDGFAPTDDDAAAALAMVLPSINEVLQAELVERDCTALEDGFTFVLDAVDVASQKALAGLGAGKDGFNAALPLPGGTVMVTSLVGQPADPEAAAELGIGAIDLPEVEAGQHEINGALTLVEEATGIRPAAAQVLVTYTRRDGAELTGDQVQAVIDHPISQNPMGLPRFGELMLLSIEDGETAATKTARFGVLTSGEVNAATMSNQVAMLTGVATAYRGFFDFGGDIGGIECASAATLVEDIIVMAPDDGHNDDPFMGY